jgi:DNA-binding response OmpR family regulator
MSTILVVDDELELRVSLSRFLQRSGYEVFTAANGHEGIALTRFIRVNVVVTDILMPEKEGLETIRQLRREFPGLKLIAVSGGGVVDPVNYLSLARKLGVDRTFAKPFSFFELGAAIRELISG